MRRRLPPSPWLTAVSPATTPSSPGLKSATSRLSVDRADSGPGSLDRDGGVGGPVMAKRLHRRQPQYKRADEGGFRTQPKHRPGQAGSQPVRHPEGGRADERPTDGDRPTEPPIASAQSGRPEHQHPD